MNNHINDLKSLKYELEQNIEFVDGLIERKSDFLTKPGLLTFNEFITENMRIASTDGKIQNNFTKKFIMKSLYSSIEANNAMETLYRFRTIPNETQQRNLEGHLYATIEENISKTFDVTYSIVSCHIKCLEQKRNYDICYSENKCRGCE